MGDTSGNLEFWNVCTYIPAINIYQLKWHKIPEDSSLQNTFKCKWSVLHNTANNWQDGIWKLKQHVTKLNTCGHTNSKTKWPLEYFIISVHTTLTTLSIPVRCISSTLWSIILGTLVSMTAELFDKLTPGSSHDGLWVGNRNDLQKFY